MRQVTSDERMAALRDGRLVDPASGRVLDLAARRIAIEPSTEGREDELLAGLDLPPPFAVVADQTTRAVMGERVARALGAASVTLERPRADIATALGLLERTRGAGTLVAVGSGTLNDLVKYAAFASRRPYAVFATAPSMNGYLTATASLAVQGLKSTLQASLPRAAIFDLEVLRQAPLRLIRAGLGDVLCRTTAEADWLLAHLLFDTPYDRRPFLLQEADEPALLAAGAALAARDPEAVLTLTRLLVLSGLGMALVGSSAPASQGEHLISHLLDLWQPDPARLHGAQVGVATLTMSRLQHRLLAAAEPPRLGAGESDPEPLLQAFEPALRPTVARALAAKRLTAAQRAALERRMDGGWPAIGARLRRVMIGTARLEQALEAAGAPRQCEDLGIEPARYGSAIAHARAVRDRYTALDLAAACGVLEAFVGDEVAR